MERGKHPETGERQGNGRRHRSSDGTSGHRRERLSQKRGRKEETQAGSRALCLAPKARTRDQEECLHRAGTRQ